MVWRAAYILLLGFWAAVAYVGGERSKDLTIANGMNFNVHGQHSTRQYEFYR